MNATPQSNLIAPPFVPFLPFPLFCGEKACAELSPVAFKIYYHIVRMTRGWRRNEAAISYEEFQKACGLKSIGQISEALKELASKGFIAIFKHTGPYGAQATSSYFLLDAAPEKTRAARSPRPAQSQRKWQPLWQQRATPPPARVSPPYDPGNFPPLGAAFSSVIIPDPFEASEPVRIRNIHAQLDQIELPSFQEDQQEVVKVVEVVEVQEVCGGEEAQETPAKAAEEKDEPISLSPLEEARRHLAELIEQSNHMYCLMASSAYGTIAHEERKKQLKKIHEERMWTLALIHRLEAV